MATSEELDRLPNKNPLYAFRLPVDEREQWKAAARREGFNSLSGWIKKLVRERVRLQQDAMAEIRKAA